MFSKVPNVKSCSWPAAGLSVAAIAVFIICLLLIEAVNCGNVVAKSFNKLQMNSLNFEFELNMHQMFLTEISRYPWFLR